jgi:scyllo-inositol 2-dehydrogenase (NADP+)
MSTVNHEKIGVGVMAFGLSGRIFHGPYIITHPNFKLVAVYERSKNESQIFASKCKVSVDLVRSEKELVERSDIQLVVVCSPIEHHYNHAMLALGAGKHVLVEKAFCSTSQQAKDLLAFAAEKGLICTPYQNRRYDSDFLTLKELLPQLGPIAEYNGYYNRFSPTVRPFHWKDSAVGSGGNFLSLGSHMIDQAVALFGLPDKVWGDVRAQREGGVLDDAWEVHLYYGTVTVDDNGLQHGGFRAIVKGSLLCRDNDLRYVVHGAQGSWIKTGVDTQETHLMSGALPKYRPGDSSAHQKEGAHVHNEFGVEPEDQWGRLTVNNSTGEGPMVITSQTPPVRGSYHYLYDSLYHAIAEGAPPAVDPQTAVAVLRIIELARQSCAEGRVLPYTAE